MMQYVPFTKEQKEQARTTDLPAFLTARGENLKRSGSEYQWGEGCDKVTVRGHLWFHHYSKTGGDAVDFVCRFFRKSYPEAVEMLLGAGAAAAPVERQRKPFVLPGRYKTMHRVFAYLTNARGIDLDVLKAFVFRGLIYESADYHNAVFVGRDPQGSPVHAHKRGTGKNSTYKGNISGSDPNYSFHWEGRSDALYVFEAPIDLLSFISMHRENWKRHSYAAACGISDHVVFRFLEEHPNTKKVCLCLDNDAAGQEAAGRIREKLNQQNMETEILVPRKKDWNEDLLACREEERDERDCEPHHCGGRHGSGLRGDHGPVAAVQPQWHP